MSPHEGVQEWKETYRYDRDLHYTKRIFDRPGLASLGCPMSVVVVVQVKLELVADQAMVVVDTVVVRSHMAELAGLVFQRYYRTDMPELRLAAAPEAR
jgi:hypothetical protein